MDIPKYTDLEQRLIRENRDLRERVRALEDEIGQQISYTGIWIKRLQEKSQQVCDLIDKYERDPYKGDEPKT